MNGIDITKRILEIGPLNTPTIKNQKGSGNNIFHVDIRSTEELKIHYDDNCKNICNIDYVNRESYEISLKNPEKFYYIIANHVLEHRDYEVCQFV